ncbi:unnamed protein product [Rotaria sp. Silwood1]|nr:unnamed protein product [Rotaria sp. Silwood1]CAF4891273.1 unnamed protein product [Rotaria sp. Silwood1]
MVTPWCVKITCLPEGTNNDELASKFGVERDKIDVPQNQQGPNYYTWVNGFSTEQLANDFIKRWNQVRIRTRTIKCKAVPTKSHVLSRPPSVPRNSDGRSCVGGHQEQQCGNNDRTQSLGPRRILESMMPNKITNDDDSDNEDDNRPKSVFTRASRFDNIITFRSKTEASSIGGKDSIPCSVNNLTTTTQRSFSRARDDSCSSRIPTCRSGSECFNANCSYRHPSGWYACIDGVDCQDFNCRGNHPYSRTNPCSQGNECKNITCKFLHPSTRMGECDAGDQCREWSCKALHSQNRPKLCFYEERCYNTACLRLHPPNRQLCSSGAECDEFSCSLNHPPGRMTKCEQGNACGNYYCMYLHSIEWDPCEAGSECTNPNCSHTSHPSDRILRLQRNVTIKTGQQQLRKQLKTIEQRHIDRQQAKLPILASKDEFCRQLKKERMLVVIAETGSGKSTQLPQYAAEYFGGLVVCTQPRVVAAVSLARRVANEYDGASVGESVGYQVGYGGTGRGNNRVPGRDILFMTDSALIQESQKDRQLSKIKVLIVDEAHERTLNTDIVIGLAKLLLDSRQTDFYVVIASATIDPARFLTFFGRTNTQVLNVPGRVFNVSIEYMPKPDDSTEDYVVSMVLKSYNDHPQGHILVFLPGQQEIEHALELFSRDIPDNCVALPLYGSLSPEEQDRVLQFDEGPTGERRMVVFCTNVAETSLTIKNTRLVIDSGLAKEARFDPKRRLMVIETVRISKSSANQRKGRAGRTASGYCIRLYNENELTRSNIEPEILRSSLDLVILQLLRLQFNPNEFPFMDSPEDTVLQKSLQLLRDLGCIDMKQAITPRGELFAELGLDPRLSAFMADTYTEYSPILELTATIGAILTAPGSLFFMGGGTKEEKQAARGRVAMGAQDHNSDLLYFASIYKNWQNTGIIDPVTRTCLTCQTLIKRFDSCRSCRVAYTTKQHSAAVRCILTGAIPPKTAMAASMLSQATSPIIIKLTDDRQKCLFNELFNENLMQTWTNELKLSCEKKDKYGTVIQIYGPQIQQGQLMRYIADYSDKFDDRYRVLDLSSEAVGYFGRHKAADVKLQEINSKWTKEGCSVTFIRKTSSILLYIQPRVSPELINTCENEVKQLLDSLLTTNTDDDSTAEQQEFARQCAFCKHTMAATRTFRICGHAYCRCALSMLNQLPMQCPTCYSRIHIQDLQEMFSNNRADFMRLCKTSIQTYLLSSTNSKDNDQLFCPNDECNGLIIRSQGYQTCLTCGQSVCGICRLIDDEMHEGRTCTERNEALQELGEFLPRLFQEAETFTRNNWPLDLPPIIRFDQNTYLKQTACESLQRFYNGVKSIGDTPPPDLARGFFAFHGTSINAIEPICKSGFDPTRRRGQVHGPGEYFGVTAAISHGYSKPDSSSLGSRMMIIAFILRCDRVKTQKGFCHVVNNPVDWSAAFNLPVVVVTYGKDVHENYPSLFAMYTTSSSTGITSTSTSFIWNSPFRWHWRQDDGTFEPYNDKINGELEQLYERWKLRNGPSNVVTSPLVRYVDDIPQTYSIDFQRNIQANTKSKFPRRIERRAVSPSKISNTMKNWYFRNEHNQWTLYDSWVQQTIENAFQLYRSEQGSNTIVIQFPGRPESYEIDFVAGKQMNKMTSEIRLIARK